MKKQDAQTVADSLRRFIDEAEGHLASMLLSTAAAARYIGVDVATLDGLSATNPLLTPVESFGGRLTWRRQDLERYLDSLPAVPECCRLLEYEFAGGIWKGIEEGHQ